MIISTVASNSVTGQTVVMKHYANGNFQRHSCTTTKRYNFAQYTAVRLTNLLKIVERGTLILTARNHMAYALNHDICGEFNRVWSQMLRFEANANNYKKNIAEKGT